MRRLSSYDLSVIAREHVRGRSDAEIGLMFDPPRDRSTVRKARARAVMQTMIRDERRRVSTANRSARYRERKREHERSPEATAERITGQPRSALVATRPGQEYPRLIRKSAEHTWTYCPQVGWNRPATAADRASFGVESPSGCEDDPGFGQPDYPRHALGYVPPDRRHVRMSHVNERGITITSPVEARDVSTREAEGWTRCPTT